MHRKAEWSTQSGGGRGRLSKIREKCDNNTAHTEYTTTLHKTVLAARCAGDRGFVYVSGGNGRIVGCSRALNDVGQRRRGGRTITMNKVPSTWVFPVRFYIVYKRARRVLNDDAR